MSNAVKFTPAGSVRVRVRAADTAQPARLRFEVADTGIGIADCAKDRLFQEFSQADVSITRRFGGTGLGLAISRRLIEAMGGTIGVVSALGAGSTFWFEIPLRAAAPVVTAEQPPHRAQPHRGVHVLIVEDMAFNQKVAAGMLRSLGHSVEVAEDGEAALAMVQARAYDVIFMDMQMPRMDGLQATTAIRALKRGHSIPIVAMTANIFEADRDACLAAGMNDLVGKPMTVQDIAAAIARVCATGAPLRSPLPSVEFDQPRFEALAKHMGVEALRSTVGGFLEQASLLLQQIEQGADSEDRVRKLGTLGEAAAVLGFSQAAHDCEAAISAADGAAAIARIRGSLQQNLARSQMLLAVRETDSRTAA